MCLDREMKPTSQLALGGIKGPWGFSTTQSEFRVGSREVEAFKTALKRKS